MNETEKKINCETVLTEVFKETGLISDRFFGELRIKYNDGKVVYIVREQSLKFKD